VKILPEQLYFFFWSELFVALAAQLHRKKNGKDKSYGVGGDIATSIFLVRKIVEKHLCKQVCLSTLNIVEKFVSNKAVWNTINKLAEQLLRVGTLEGNDYAAIIQ
jgi:hypothetical protein